jgi:glycosyltransferase involved in cell wall biosynthesis
MSDSPASDTEISDSACLVKMPSVSILMAAYNHGPFLAEAIEGVLSQRANFPIELLIGEDHSSDDTRAVALGYQKLHPDIIRVIFSDTNIGQHNNNARLVRASRGEFIAYCDGDDYWSDPEKLRRQVDYLRAHADAGAVHTDFDRIISRGGHWCRLPNYQQHRYAGSDVPAGGIFATLLRGNFIQTCTFCVRANLYREFLGGGFLKDSYSVSDWPLCLFVAAKHKIAYLAESTAVYRKVPGSMMNSGHAIRARTVASYVPMIEDFCAWFRVDDATRIEALSQLYRNLFALFFFTDDIPAFERVLSWLRANDPTFLLSWQRRLKIRFVQVSWIRKLLARKHELAQAFEEWLYYRPDTLVRTPETRR